MIKDFKKVISLIVVIAVIFCVSTQILARSAHRFKRHKSKVEVLMVVAPKNIEDLEFFVPKSILETNGAKVTVASTTLDTAIGTHGAQIKPDIEISNVRSNKFDAIFVVGGTGSIEFLWEDASLRKLLIEANDKNKIIGAICGAPPALSKAGIMNGKTATMYPWEDGIKELEKYGATYVDEEVVVSENIITGKNVEASEAFGLKLCEVLGISVD